MNFIKNLLSNKIFYFCLVFLIIGFAAGTYWSKPQIDSSNQTAQNGSQDIEFHAGGYRLINPLYECNNLESYGVKEFGSLEKSLSDYIDKIITGTSVSKVSVYFRDLNNGPWFGIREKEDFAPSSLLKLPVMMAYFKKAEDDPTVLTKKIEYDKDPEGLIPQNFNTKNPLKKGKEYTVEELIKRMIEGSDNVSLLLLEANINSNDIDKVTKDLDIPTANVKTPNNFMSVKEYSSLFRVLFNSSYLNRKYSEEALDILSNSEFKNGIVDGIPANITISHKFGERRFPDGTNQLHDCGIVYYPNRPYLLCIMTNGTDFNELQTTIQQISSKVYLEFKNRYH